MPWTPITAAAAAVSFWRTVALAATGSLLSALCILDPVSEPKRTPYFFIGQWFTWLATPCCGAPWWHRWPVSGCSLLTCS